MLKLVEIAGIVGIVLFYDLWFYGVHRLLHHKLFYEYHKIHHSVKHDKLTYLHAASAHLVENILTNVGFIIPVVLFKTDTKTTIITYLFISIRGGLRHEKSLCWLIGTHHIDHHEYPNYNYSTYIVDYVFGTVKPQN